MLTYIAIAVMILLLIGMLVVKKTMASSPMLQPILFLCVALELGLVIFVFYNQLSGGGAATDALEKACRKEAAKAVVAGKKLKSAAAGKKALLIMPNGSKESKQGQAFIKALTENYGQVTVDEPKANPESDIGITKKDIDEVLAKHKDAELVIFYNSLPEGYKAEDKKVYFLFDRGSGDGKQIKKDIESGKIIGIVLSQDKVTVKASDPVEKDPEEAFKKRYILIDKGNIGANAKYFD